MWGSCFAAAPALPEPAGPDPRDAGRCHPLGHPRTRRIHSLQPRAGAPPGRGTHHRGAGLPAAGRGSLLLSRQRKGHFIHPDVLKGRTPGGAAASSPWRRPPHRLVAAPVAAAQPAAQHRQGRGLAALPLSLPVRPVRQGAVSHGRLARMLPQGPGRAGHTPVGARPDRARRRDADPAGADQDPAQARRLGLGRRADHHRGCAARPLHGGRPADARGHGRGHRGARLPRRAQHLQQPHLPGHPAAGGRPGPAGHAAAAPAGLPLRDAQPPVPHGRDHAAGPARGAAGDGRGARHHPHRGRLRERAASTASPSRHSRAWTAATA